MLDETENVYGRLTVIKRIQKKHKKQIMWSCKCQCGNIVSIMGISLRNGCTTSCGCFCKEQLSKRFKKDEIGKTYGKLTIISEDGRNKHGHVMWKCRCDCGNIKTINGNGLRMKNSRSCGCTLRVPSSHRKDEIGNIYGKLTVISEAKKDATKVLKWNCRCTCGNIRTVAGYRLRSGRVTQCLGCKRG